MKSLKPVAAVSAVAASALLLAGCSAGQIAQTSSQVAAVDGGTTTSTNGELVVQDATIVLSENGQAALKFTAINQDKSKAAHTLNSVAIKGTRVELNPAPKPIEAGCSIVADSSQGIESFPQSDSDCVQYIETSVENQEFAYGGHVPVTFSFDRGTVEVDAPVSAPILPSGQFVRGSEHEEAPKH